MVKEFTMEPGIKNNYEREIDDKYDDKYIEELKLLLKQHQRELMNEIKQEEVQRKRLINLDNELIKLEYELKQIEKDKNKFKKSFESIQQRRSWRYMAPFRRVYSLLKNSKKLFRGQRNKTTSVNQLVKQKSRKDVKLKIMNLKMRLYGLGFTERAFSDLENLALNGPETELKKMAAWELALYYANQYSTEGAKKCLEILPIAMQGLDYKTQLIRKVTIEAESYEILGQVNRAKQIVSHALEVNPKTSFYLLAANLEQDEHAKLKWINKALQVHDLSKVNLAGSPSLAPYFRLGVEKITENRLSKEVNVAKVSVIMPVYNAESVINVSLKSLLKQTWTNLEIIVVDDCSTDSTAKVVEEYVKSDSRVKLIKAEENGGTYVARNLGLQIATGDFVTCHDADDWSHPEKIEKQALHLLKNPSIVGNYSQAVRVTEDLKFFRRSKRDIHIFVNTSSLMFRRKPVMDTIGYWDSVRFSSDSEFIARLIKVFGKEKLTELSTGPLSFTLQSSNSLTGNRTFGYHGFKMGARKEYYESYIEFHDNTNNFYYDFPQKKRPFPVPDPMLPCRRGHKHFDVILVSDFRLGEINDFSNTDVISKLQNTDLKCGLVQMSLYEVSPKLKLNYKVRNEVDGEKVQLLVFGESVSCDFLLVMDSEVLRDWQQFIPKVHAENIHIVINKIHDSRKSIDRLVNLFRQYDKNLRKYFGKSGLWHPINQSVRKEVQSVVSHDPELITLSNDDWSNELVNQILTKNSSIE